MISFVYVILTSNLFGYFDSVLLLVYRQRSSDGKEKESMVAKIVCSLPLFFLSHYATLYMDF